MVASVSDYRPDPANAIVRLSNRVVFTIDGPDDTFYIRGSGRTGVLGSPVHGPFANNDPRFIRNSNVK